ncbi:PEP-CTERM sorting domain-containing protein [Pseudoduganella plicata]|uniref:PEP-CTERM sorting domain-containing protein n=1 Tax=Pseudoduganella plicata TaxID=321984 RepID=A0A4V1AU80_9BURK|nr:PEP-CTERM sorting domain-containing protein [Pseudoduganella plicata]QBQ38238.1 PEP-CTERM sorting domain-containing protein [Pseudoduganella plicata]GGY80472.1 hypothetical protein GCM10007388_11390 [Pseudoduganella plicata]
MFKSVAFAALFAATFATSSAASAAAGPITWTFAYTGFFNQAADAFVKDYRLAGSFTGMDADRDGFVRLNEITSFTLGSTNYLTCGDTGNPYYTCGMSNFSYQVGGKLEFYASTDGRDPEGMAGSGHYIHAGFGEYDYRYNPFEYTELGNVWTEQTRFQIAPMMKSGAVSPVPEPGTWAMLATGLLLVGATASRRRGQPAAR